MGKKRIWLRVLLGIVLIPIVGFVSCTVYSALKYRILTPERMDAMVGPACAAIQSMDVNGCDFDIDEGLNGVRFSRRGETLHRVGDDGKPVTVTESAENAALFDACTAHAGKIHSKVLQVIENDWIRELVADETGGFYGVKFYAKLSDDGIALFTDPTPAAEVTLAFHYDGKQMTFYSIDFTAPDGSRVSYDIGDIDYDVLFTDSGRILGYSGKKDRDE